MGELALWFVRSLGLDVELGVVAMNSWMPATGPGYGWPLGERSWVNPSPNAPGLSMARCYAGTVMLEGTTAVGGAGHHAPAGDLRRAGRRARELMTSMQRLAPQWLRGCRLRECWFEPTFHKHAGRLCAGLQIHVDDPAYEHAAFRPWRLMALAFKALRLLRPDYDLWRDFAYEYERDRLAIDLINGSDLLREWVDDRTAVPADLDALAVDDEESWLEEREGVLLYR